MKEFIDSILTKSKLEITFWILFIPLTFLCQTYTCVKIVEPTKYYNRKAIVLKVNKHKLLVRWCDTKKIEKLNVSYETSYDSHPNDIKWFKQPIKKDCSVFICCIFIFSFLMLFVEFLFILSI